MRAWVSWIAALLCAATSLAGAAPVEPAGRISFRSYAADDGLTNLVVTGIAEDGDGARWVATDEGVFRLDGERFVRVRLKDGLSSAHVHAIATAPTGELCVGTPVELACGRHGKFSRLLEHSVTRMARTPDALWIMTARGLYAWRGQGVPMRVTGAPDHPLPLLWADRRGVVMGAGTQLMLSRDGLTWSSLEVELPDGADVRELLRDESGALWLRTETKIWRVLAGEQKGRDVTFELPPSMDLRFGQTMALSPAGELAVGTSRGLAFFRGDRWELLDAERGLPTASAHLVYYDRGGELWLGSVGMHRRLGRGLIERHTAASGLPGEAVWAIERTSGGALLLGTDRCLVQASGGRWTCVEGTEGRVVRSIANLPDGGVLFGGVPAELWTWTPGGAATKVADLAASFGARQLLAVHADADGTLWLGADNGLYWRAPGGAVAPVLASGGRTKRFVSAIVADGPRTWFAGYEGVRVREDDKWTQVTEQSGLRATAVRYLARRHDGRLCVLYDEALGLTCFRYGAGGLSELLHIDAQQGLDSLAAYSLGEDAAGRLWLGTGGGLRVISSDTSNGIDRFTERDGIAGDDATAMAFHLDRDGSLWFGSSRGLTRVAASNYHGAMEPPTVRMLSLALGERSLLEPAGQGGAAPGGPGGPGGSDEALADGSGDGSDGVPAAGELRGGFVANHADPSNIEYQVRLWPEQQDWAPAPSRQVRYQDLAAGNYQLEVQARVRGGAWGPIARTAFSIPLSWWQLRWLWALGGVVAVTGLVLLVLRVQRAALRRRTRVLLAQTEAGFRTFLASMPELVILRRQDGAVHLNEAARALFGEESEREKMWLLRVVHPGDRERAAELLRGAPMERRWSTGKLAGLGGSAPPGPGPGPAPVPEAMKPVAHGPELVELRVLAGGEWRDLEVSHQTVTLGGAPARILVGRDVTEQRRLQAKMLMADRMVSLGTLVAGIGHEINNPLSYVLGNLEVVAELAERGDLAAHRREMLGAVHDALEGAARVRTIVRRLAAFSRSSEDVRAPVLLDEVIAQAVRLTHNELRHRAELVQELEQVAPVLADPGQLTQVIINLLINAAHAIPPGAADRNRITIATRQEGEQVILEVTDTGSGMDEQVVAHAFDPFFTTKKVGEGTGLGLSICHGIVTSHGGQILIESQRGRGTTMRVALPAYRGVLRRTAPVVAVTRASGQPGLPNFAAIAAGLAGEPRAAGAAAAPSQALVVPVIPATPTAPVAPAESREGGGEGPEPVVAELRAVGSGSHARSRVLVIDDEPAVGKVLARMLRAEHDVVVLTDGEDAVRRVSGGERFAAIITDVMMPVLTGLELREQLQAIDPDQARRVVFITGGVFNADTAEQIEQLHVPCMTKPVDAEVLRRTVSEMVATAPCDVVAPASGSIG